MVFGQLVRVLDRWLSQDNGSNTTYMRVTGRETNISESTHTTIRRRKVWRKEVRPTNGT